ncbi:hypothetical protein F5X71_16620 [Nocardia brasiliensis]|uniref:Uncharacterized protein n=1 Tax=Nocardia brasiliensis TaxID=37326 RepID=A0A6G9XS35_NOCBR|nr:hypothetical protein [Nocardia brasiliensis]QIS03727.1 hypothetical protein F5X71_16620 [Nocardia brasiliensis]
MTISSIAQLAVDRHAPSRTRQPKGAAVTAASAAGGADRSSENGTAVLARAVPTDIIVFYTALVGLLEGIQKDSNDSYYPLRWFIYAFALLATLVAVTVATRLRTGKTQATDPPLPVGDPIAQPTPQAPNQQPEPNQQPVPNQQPPNRARQRLSEWWQRWSPPPAETITATFAFAVWGLITPGSPLYVALDSPVLPIVVGILTAGGALVMTVVISPILGRAADRP